MKEITKENITNLINSMECITKKGMEGAKKDIDDGFYCSALEWNRMESLAEGELKLAFANNLKRITKLPEVTELLTNWKVQLEEDLLGHSLLGNPGSGPWDSSSTSSGYNRLAIIKANHKRHQLHTIRNILKILKEN